MESNRDPSAYQPNAIPLGQTGSRTRILHTQWTHSLQFMIKTDPKICIRTNSAFWVPEQLDTRAGCLICDSNLVFHFSFISRYSLVYFLRASFFMGLFAARRMITVENCLLFCSVVIATLFLFCPAYLRLEAKCPQCPARCVFCLVRAVSRHYKGKMDGHCLG